MNQNLCSSWAVNLSGSSDFDIHVVVSSLDTMKALHRDRPILANSLQSGNSALLQVGFKQDPSGLILLRPVPHLRGLIDSTVAAMDPLPGQILVRASYHTHSLHVYYTVFAALNL